MLCFLFFAIQFLIVGSFNFKSLIRNDLKISMAYGDFYSKSKSGLYRPTWDMKGMSMADPDIPPEVDPTRR
jgi:hypothetical protein